MLKFIRLCFVALLCNFLSLSAVPLLSPEPAPEPTPIDSTKKYYKLSGVSILGDRSKALSEIPGSAIFINSETLELQRAFTGNEVLRRVAGLNISDEEGLGLRLNVGVRGLDPDRSRSVLIMEDGIPVSLSPYGEPELYYTPSMDRMTGVEVLKGSGSIMYGPQTIGGVINYITADPIKDARSYLNLSGGNGGFAKAQVGYGASNENMGFMIEYLHKQADKIVRTGFNTHDLTAKLKINLNEKSNITAKIGVYDEVSNSTYLALTQTMFDRGEYFTVMTPNDNLDVRRYSASLTHNYIVADNLLWNTSVFGYTTTRNWRRQDFSRSESASNQTGQVWGDPTVPGGAVFMRNSTGSRNRQFEVLGVQSSIYNETEIAGIKNEIDFGVRAVYERAFEQRVNGTFAKAKSGTLVEDEIRTGYGISAFFQDRINLTEDLILTPGIRYEHFLYERDILRRASKDTSIISDNGLGAIIPGVGINYNIGTQSTVFAGMHRGFAPPRTKDAITSAGVALDLDAELSWNYELGVRSTLTDWLFIEVTGFYLDFTNQIIPVSESSGGLGTGVINGGETQHIGVETAFEVDFARLLTIDMPIRLNINATLNNATFSADRFRTVGEERVNINGNQLPYAPQTIINAMLDMEPIKNLSLFFGLTMVGEQYGDVLNTVAASPSGEIGLIDSYMILDATVRYRFEDYGFALFTSIKNITDERYIASRRPQGIQVGLPRMITGGIDFNF